MANYKTAFKLKVVKSFLAGNGGAEVADTALGGTQGENSHLGQSFPALWH